MSQGWGSSVQKSYNVSDILSPLQLAKGPEDSDGHVPFSFHRSA